MSFEYHPDIKTNEIKFVGTVTFVETCCGEGSRIYGDMSRFLEDDHMLDYWDYERVKIFDTIAQRVIGDSFDFEVGEEVEIIVRRKSKHS